MEGKQDGGHQKRAARLRWVGRPNLVNVGGAVVGNHHFLEQAPKDLAHAVNGGGVVETAFLLELRQEVRGTLDGARHQLREEADVGEERHGVVGGAHAATIDIDGVGQRLECVERDADRQDEVQQKGIGLKSKQLRELADEEVVVLEQGEDAEVEDDVGPKDELLPFRIALDADAAQKRAQSGEGDEDQETPVPPAVKDIRRDDNQHVLDCQLVLASAYPSVADEPIEEKHYRQEKQKLNGIEEHCFCFLCARFPSRTYNHKTWANSSKSWS